MARSAPNRGRRAHAGQSALAGHSRGRLRPRRSGDGALSRRRHRPRAGDGQSRPDPLRSRRQARPGHSRRLCAPRLLRVREGARTTKSLPISSATSPTCSIARRRARTPAIDRYGRPPFVRRTDVASTLGWVKPLSDPLGGTDASSRPPSRQDGRADSARGRAGTRAAAHPRLAAAFGGLRCGFYGHPQLLAVAEAINGPDFTPFNEAHLDQASAPRRLGRLAPGRLDPLEQPRRWTRTPTASTS